MSGNSDLDAVAAAERPARAALRILMTGVFTGFILAGLFEEQRGGGDHGV
jgi:hypothetical protein